MKRRPTVSLLTEKWLKQMQEFEAHVDGGLRFSIVKDDEQPLTVIDAHLVPKKPPNE